MREPLICLSAAFGILWVNLQGFHYVDCWAGIKHLQIYLFRAKLHADTTKDGKRTEEWRQELTMLLKLGPENHTAMNVKIKGCRNIEEDIEKIIFIYRVVNYERGRRGYIDLIIYKNRAWAFQIALCFVKIIEEV